MMSPTRCALSLSKGTLRQAQHPTPMRVRLEPRVSMSSQPRTGKVPTKPVTPLHSNRLRRAEITSLRSGTQ